MDTRIKLITMLVFLTGTMSLEDMKLLSIDFIFLFIALGIIRVSIKSILKRFLFTIPFVGVLVLVMPFQIPGEPIFLIHSNIVRLSPTYEGFHMAIRVWLKALISVLTVLILTETTSESKIFQGLHSLGVHGIMIQIIEFTLRYFGVIHQEFIRITIAQRSRGFEKGKHLLDIHTFQVIGGSIGYIFLRSLDRSERIYRAMLSRGYNQQRRHKEPLSMGKKDGLIFSLVLLFMCFLIWMDIYRGGIG